MYDQDFRLYNIQTNHLPLQNFKNKWMVAKHKPYIAVNIDTGPYMTLNDNWYEALECQGQHNVYCKSASTQRFFIIHCTCELAMFFMILML